MTPCPACTTAAVNPHTGMFYAGCTGCEIRAAFKSPEHHDHMKNLKTIPGSLDRREYIAAVERRSGPIAAEALRQEYGQWWESRRAKA